MRIKSIDYLGNVVLRFNMDMVSLSKILEEVQTEKSRS